MVKVGAVGTLKLRSGDYSYGWRQKTGAEWEWVNTGRKSFSYVSIVTGGRGWMRLSTPIVLVDGPVDLSVEVIGLEAYRDKQIPIVKIINGHDLRVADLAKNPYVRKTDGKSAPQVQLHYKHPNDCSNPDVPEEQVDIFKKMYGLQNYTDPRLTDQWVRETFSDCPYVEELVNSVTAWVMAKDLDLT